MASAARRGGGSPVAYLSRVVLAISHSAVFLSCSAFSVSLVEFLAATGHSGQATSFFAHLSSSPDGLVAAAAAAADVSSKTTNFYRPTDHRRVVRLRSAEPAYCVSLSPSLCLSACPRGGPPVRLRCTGCFRACFGCPPSLSPSRNGRTWSGRARGGKSEQYRSSF